MIFLEVIGNVALDLTPQINEISKWVKGLGILALIIAIYSVTMFLINRKQAKDLNSIKKKLNEVNEKLDKLIKRK